MPIIRSIRVLTLSTLAALCATLAAVPAAAMPRWSEPVNESFTFVGKNWCGVSGLNVRVIGTATGWEGFKPGPGAFEYFHSKLKIDETHIAPNGRRTRYTATVVDKDTSVTETKTTLEVDVLATGNSTLYGPTGKAIARDPGQVRFHLSINKATGQETFTLLRDSTGRTDDFCAAELAAFGVA